jgi:hypothetical protein
VPSVTTVFLDREVESALRLPGDFERQIKNVHDRQSDKRRALCGCRLFAKGNPIRKVGSSRRPLLCADDVSALAHSPPNTKSLSVHV